MSSLTSNERSTVVEGRRRSPDVAEQRRWVVKKLSNIIIEHRRTSSNVVERANNKKRTNNEHSCMHPYTHSSISKPKPTNERTNKGGRKKMDKKKTVSDSE